MTSRAIIKVLVFIALLGVFYGFGGFEPPRFSRDVYRSSRRMERAWFSTVALYVVGAWVALWGEKPTGIIHPVSFRSAYIILGVIALVAGFFWMRALKSTETAHARLPNSAPANQQCGFGVGIVFCRSAFGRSSLFVRR